MQNADCCFLSIANAQGIFNTNFFQFFHHIFYWR